MVKKKKKAPLSKVVETAFFCGMISDDCRGVLIKLK